MINKAAKVVFVALVTVFLATGFAAAFQDPAPVTEAEYWVLAETTISFLSTTDQLEADQLRAGLDALATRWEAITALERQGAIMDLDTRWISQQLREDPANILALRALFDGMVNQPALDTVHDQGALGSLERILARPEFSYEISEPSDFELLLERFQNWVASLLDRLIPDSINININGLASIGPIVGITSAVIIVLIFLYVLRSTSRGLVSESVDSRDPIGHLGSLSADQALSQANSLSQQGDLRGAVRYLYLSALLTIEERGLVRHDRSLTNRELLRLLRGDPAMRTTLKRVVEVFDRVWYGHQAIEPDEFAAYSQEISALQRRGSGR